MTLAMGGFGWHVAARIAAYSASYLAAGLVLFWAFDLIEAANTGRSLGASVADSAATLPQVGLRIGKFALLLGALTAGHRFMASNALVAWFSAGGHPLALAFAALGVGIAGAGLGAATVQLALRTDRAPAEGRAPSSSVRWLRTANTIVRLTDPAPTAIAEVVILRIERGALVARATGTEVQWVDDRWRAKRQQLRTFGHGADRYSRRAQRAPGAAFPLAITPADLRAVLRPGDDRLGRRDGAFGPVVDGRTIALRRRWGQPYRRASLAWWRRRTEPVAWSLSCALGLALALVLSTRASAVQRLFVGLIVGFGLHLAQELAAASVDAALVPPFLGAFTVPALAALGTVAVWGTVLGRGIRD